MQREGDLERARNTAAQYLLRLRKLKREEKQLKQTASDVDAELQTAQALNNAMALWQIKQNREKQLIDTLQQLEEVKEIPIVNGKLKEQLRNVENRKHALENAIHTAVTSLAENRADHKALQEQLDTNRKLLEQSQTNAEAKGLLQTLRMALAQDR